MRRLSRTALLILALLLLLLAPALAAADPLIPGRPAGSPAYGVPAPLYEDQLISPYAYTFEGQSQNDIGHVPIYFGINALLVAKAWLLKLSLRTAEYALVQDFMAPFLSRASQVTGSLRQLLWEGRSPLVVGALSLTGLWAILLYLRGRTSRVWASLGGSILVVMVTAALLTAGPGWAQAAGGVSRDLAGQVYGALDGLGRDSRGWGLVARSGDALWRTLVYQPWVTGEFGDDDQARAGAQLYGQLDAGSFLRKTVNERTLICVTERRLQPYCPWWVDEYLPRRLLIAGWTFLATAAVGGAIAVLSGGIILAQLALLVLLMLSPVWLLVALWSPEHGRRLLSALWMRALGALVTQVVMATTLGVLLLLSLTVSSAFTDGWMLQSLLLTGLALMAFRYRTAWLEPLAAVQHRLKELSGRAEQESQQEGARQEGSRQAAAASVSMATLATLAPAFAGLGLAAGPVAGSEADRDREELPALGALGGTESGGPDQLPAPAPHLAHFQSEMQNLREQIGHTERLSLREEVSRVGLPPGEPGWEPPPGTVRRRHVPARDRISDVTQLPSQRPRP